MRSTTKPDLHPPDRIGDLKLEWEPERVRARWGRRVWHFAVARSQQFTPKAVQRLIDDLRRQTDGGAAVFVPYLSPERLDQLQEAGISGIDGCGNALLLVPGDLYVRESGHPNRFPSSAPIKNIYRGKSGLVCRLLLRREPVPFALDELTRLIEAESGGQVTITPSAVSKVLSQLDEEGIIRKDRRRSLPHTQGIPVLRRSALLHGLAADYVLQVRRRVTVRCPLPIEELMERLAIRVRACVAGGDSAAHHLGVPRATPTSICCSSIVEALRQVPEATPDERWADYILIETEDPQACFGAVRAENGVRYAGAVQTWLELEHGDQRDRSLAQKLELLLTEPLT